MEITRSFLLVSLNKIGPFIICWPVEVDAVTSRQKVIMFTVGVQVIIFDDIPVSSIIDLVGNDHPLAEVFFISSNLSILYSLASF